MPETPTQSPNPIQLFKQQYPGYANTPDVHVYNFLANPANFKRAFPGYAQTPDSQIQGFMQKFIPGDQPGQQIPSTFQGPLPSNVERARSVYKGKDILLKPGEAPKGTVIPGGKAIPPPTLMQKAEAEAGKFLKPLQTPIPGAGWGVPGLYLPAKALAALGQAVPKTASPTERLAAGAAQAPKAMIEAFTTPENAITLSGFLVLPEGAVAKTLGGLFTAQQAAQTFSQFKEGLAAWRNGDYEKAGTLLASAPMSALFTALGAAKLAGDLTKASEVIEPTEKSVKGEVISKEPLKPSPVEQVEINKPLVTKVAREAPKPQTPTQKVEAIRQEMQSKAVASTTKPSQTVPASLEQQKNTYRQFLTNPELVNRAVQMPNGELAVPTGGERTQGKLDFIDSKNWKQQQTESIQFLKGRPGFENVRAGGYNGRSVVWGLDTNEGGKPGYKTPGEINRSQWQTTQVAPASQVRPTPVPRPQPTPTPLTPEALARFTEQATKPQKVSAIENLINHSKPRYGYRDHLFELQFESPTDKALYTIAQQPKNKIHDSVMEYLKTKYPNLTDQQIIQKGKQVRERIKQLAANAPYSQDMLHIAVTPEQAAEVHKPTEPKLTPIKSPVAQEQFYPDAKAAQQLAQFDQPVPEMIQNSRIQQAQTQLAKLDHSLYGVGQGRVPQLADNQRRFLEQQRVKAQRELKFQVFEHVKTLAPQQQAQKLIEYGNRAESNLKIGNALIAASKEKETAPAWLEPYVESIRTNNPSLRKKTLERKLTELRAGAQTEDDQKAIDLVDKYLHTLYQAETERGQSIPLSMTFAHMRKLGNRFLRQGKSDRQIANAIKYRIGIKREKAAIASVPQEQAPKAEVYKEPPHLPQKAVDEFVKRHPDFVEWAKGPKLEAKIIPEPKPSESLKTVPVEASKETQVPLETVEPTAAEAPVHIEGGALSLEQLEEKGFEARAETLSPEEELLKGEQESEQERKYSALAKNLERSSLRDAFKSDMLKAIGEAGGDTETADRAIEGMPLDKLLTAPWPKEVRGVIERYAQAAQPSTVKRTIEITPTQNLSETSKQWLSAIDALEDHFVYSGEYDAIRRAVPSHFTPEKKLERYATALQKYIEWDEDQDPKALKRAVALASRDPEKGAVTISHEPLDSLVIYKKAQREGYNVSFTHSSPLYPASWIIGDGPNQIQIEVGTWDSHVAIANKLEAKGEFEKYGHLSGAARTAALKKYNQVMENWLDKGAIRKASNNAFQIRRLDDPKNLNKVWDLFKRNLHALRNYNDPAHFQEDPALFIESLRNLQGASTSDMEVPLTYTYIQDRFGGDIVKAVYANLGLYSEDQDRYLHSGPPIKEAIDYIKNTPVATRIKHALNFVVNWATAELNGGRVPSTFLRSQYYKKLSHAELRETLGQLDRASAILQNQLDTYREWWNDLPLETRQEKFWDFMDAVETGKQLTDPHLQEMADLGRALEDDRFNQLSVLGKAPHYIENYWHHLWENPKKATRFVSDWVRGKHPLQGSVKFKRTRIHPLYSDGRAAGLVPKSYNPIEVLLQSLNMKDRYIHMNRLANWLKEQGVMKFARDPRKLPPLEIGWGHIDDPMMEPKFRTKEGLVSPGKWYVPKPYADIFNNYLHPGWDNHLAYRGARAYINRINMTTLGLSAFHIMTTAYNSMAIDGAYGLQSLLDAAKYRDPNRLKLATLAFIRGMVPGASLIDNMLKGAHVYDTWLHPEQAKAIHEQITQVGVKANLPFKWERYYFQDDTEKFWQAWHDASLKHPWSYSKVAWHGLFAPFEALSKPIFNYIVPLGKLGALAKLAERELYLESKQDPRLVNPESKMLRGAAIADRLDDAFGEVEYDNFRMSWWAKSLAKLGFKSAGWSLGTGRLGEHAFSDFVKEPFRAASGYGFEVPLATGYFMALAVGMAMYNTLLQLWLTSGKGKPEFPSSLKDLMYPKDGEGGRVYPKTYITDIISFAHEPITTIWHKASPLATLFYLARNQDFMGYEITDPMASLGQNIYHVLNFGVKEGLPLSVKNWQFQATKGASLAEKAIASVGVTRAPRWIINDAFQNRLDQLVEPQFAAGPKTYRERARVENMAKFRGERLAGKLTDAEVYRMVKDGTILPQDGKRLLKFSNSSAMENEFSKINLEQALWAWQKASKSEKGMFADVLAKKASQIPNWGLKEFETLEEAQKDIHSLTHQLDSALANFPFSRIEARLYIAAGQETLDYNRQYFMQQRPPHIHGMPTIQQLTGMPHPKARGPNIGVTDALKRIDLQFKQAMARNDKNTAGILQQARQSLLLSWWSQYLRDHPRAGVPSQAGVF